MRPRGHGSLRFSVIHPAEVTIRLEKAADLNGILRDIDDTLEDKQHLEHGTTTL